MTPASSSKILPAQGKELVTAASSSKILPAQGLVSRAFSGVCACGSLGIFVFSFTFMIPPHKLTKSCRRHAIAILSTTTCCLRQTDSLSKLVNLAQNAQTPQLDLFHFLRCPACSTTVTIAP